MVFKVFKKFTALSVLTGALFAFAPAMAQDISRKTEREIAEAMELSEEGNRAGAVERINDRLDDRGLNDTDRAALLLARAKTHAAGEGGDLAAAEADLQAALALPGVPGWQRDEVVQALAELYVFQGRPEQALSVLRDHDSLYGSSDTIQQMIHELEIDTGVKIPTDLPDRPIKPVSTRAPSFPAGCARGAPEYKVSVVFDVSVTGDPVNIRILDSTDPCLAPAAMTTVSSWRFDPAVQSGYFVITRDVPVTVTFTAG
ncbi:hypothetical protein FF098_004995 [Parvularcula flava]|uniref:TonB C-terminal domain-containing protein n=1 Tax=Aquisalinus luteolus TaxID=1566827 RepID=A0A8J3EQQ7_9PROT|nr:energy transducer TonB [Aquisalinus luteolus]NHK27253.1 hypothetical protein [Aquisalinus luteolus]GGH94875.1 hypothetical protein GCM10011355_10090 [Aquisalinus luteolus]